MTQIRPISDLRNKFTEISRIVHEEKEPVFLTKNGYGDMVVMSIEDYQDKKFIHEIDLKLLKARDEILNSESYSHEDVMSDIKKIIKNASTNL